MDTTIRNLDEAAYRELKARAALTGKTIGDLLNDAIRSYLARPVPLSKRGSLRDLVPESYPKGNERLSERIDAIAYGIRPPA
jgi:plasmid stability protein